MVGLRFTFGFVRGFDCGFRKNRRVGHKFELGDGNQNGCDFGSDLGYRALYNRHRPDKKYIAALAAVSDSFGAGNGGVVAVLLQGNLAWRRFASCARRQTKRCLCDNSFVSNLGRTRFGESDCRRRVDCGGVARAYLAVAAQCPAPSRRNAEGSGSDGSKRGNRILCVKSGGGCGRFSCAYFVQVAPRRCEILFACSAIYAPHSGSDDSAILSEGPVAQTAAMG